MNVNVDVSIPVPRRTLHRKWGRYVQSFSTQYRPVSSTLPACTMSARASTGLWLSRNVICEERTAAASQWVHLGGPTQTPRAANAEH